MKSTASMRTGAAQQMQRLQGKRQLERRPAHRVGCCCLWGEAEQGLLWAADAERLASVAAVAAR